MHWNENLYRLHEKLGGAFFGTPPAGLAEDVRPNGTLILPYRGAKVTVCPEYDAVVRTNISGGAPRGGAMWTMAAAEVELNRRRTVTVQPQKGLRGLLGKKTEALSIEGYQVKTDDEAFARLMLSRPALQGCLRRAREAAPAVLPLFLRLAPSGEGNTHVVEARTNLFPAEWCELKGIGDGNEVVPIEKLESASAALLELLVETCKAAYDAACDAPV